MNIKTKSIITLCLTALASMPLSAQSYLGSVFEKEDGTWTRAKNISVGENKVTVTDYDSRATPMMRTTTPFIDILSLLMLSRRGNSPPGVCVLPSRLDWKGSCLLKFPLLLCDTPSSHGVPAESFGGSGSF